MSLWERIEHCINTWADKSPPKWWKKKFSIGSWLILRCILLLALIVLSFRVPILLSVWSFFTLVILADILVVNTSVCLFTRNPRSKIRAIVFTLFAFIQLGLAFSVYYATLSTKCMLNQSLGIVGTIYFSFVTMLTLGYGDVLPTHEVAQLTTIIQVNIGLYFISILIAYVVGKLAQDK